MININGKHLEITEPIREYALEKVGKLPRYYDRVTNIDVLADKNGHKDEVCVEVIVHIAKSDPFVVTEAGDDLYACIDEAVRILERRLTDLKEKQRNRKHTKA